MENCFSFFLKFSPVSSLFLYQNLGTQVFWRKALKGELIIFLSLKNNTTKMQLETISFSEICFAENLFVDFGCMLISFSTKSFCGFLFHKTFFLKFASLAFPQNRFVGFFPQNASVEIWFISFFQHWKSMLTYPWKYWQFSSCWTSATCFWCP